MTLPDAGRARADHARAPVARAAAPATAGASGRAPRPTPTLMRLQASAGNAAVTALLRTGSRPKPSPTDAPGPAIAQATASAARGPAVAASATRVPAAAGSVAFMSGAVDTTTAPVSAPAPAELERAVQRLVRGGPVPPPPVPPPPPAPHAHPGLRLAKRSIALNAAAAARHPSPASKAQEAQQAAQPPAGDRDAQAKAAKADALGAVPAGGFDKAAFVAAVKAAIDKQTPKTLEDADEFGKSGKADQVGAEVRGIAGRNAQAAARPMNEASARPPDPSRAVEKDVTPLPAQGPPGPLKIDAAQAAPSRAPPEQTDLRNGPAETDRAMSDAGVTEDQLRRSNEPEFTGALTAKAEAEQHSATAPAQLRAQEGAQLAQATQAAAGAGTATSAGLMGVGAANRNGVARGQQTARTKDEQERAAVTANVTRLFDETKTAVDGILNGIDAKVDEAFKDGEGAAKKAFTEQHTREMKAFRDKRYSYDTVGAMRWAADLLLGPEPEVDEIFRRARATYEREMTKAIDRIADLVGGELNAAKVKVAEGRARIAAYTQSLNPSLRKVGADAAKEVGGRFDELEASVDEKGQALAEDLATKYVEARNVVDDEIKAMQEANKGLVDKAKDAVVGAVETILKLKTMLLGALARAAGAVEKIIKDPIAFLGNLVNAVKSGIMAFGANIATHLKNGLQTWLFGALSAAGIDLPAKFDLQGVLKLVLSILGLTWANVRARIAAKLPPGAIELVEQGFDVVKLIIKEGLGGIWRIILEKVGDIKDMIMGQVKEMVAVEIIKAGIVWLVSMLNPASAFVKACKMIYDVVMFFVEKAEQIKAFVDSILDSVESIASGGVGAVAGYIENTLGRMVPVIIGFMASLLGLGGISGKIKKIIEAVQKPVNKVIDWVVGKAVAFGKKAISLGKRALAKVKAKGKEAWGKLKKKIGIKEKTPEEKERAGAAAGVAAINRFAGKRVGQHILKPALGLARIRNGLAVLEAVPGEKHWMVRASVQREQTAESNVDSSAGDEAKDGPVSIKVENSSSAPPPYIGPERQLGPGKPTTFTLAQILKMPPSQEKYKAAETFIAETYQGTPQVHSPVPQAPTSNFAVEGTGGRHTDTVAAGGVGQTLGIEVKTYMRWRTVNGVAVAGSVPLSDEIIEQVNKDVHLRKLNPGYDPRWIFLEAPPHPKLANYLSNAGIVSIVFAKPVKGNAP